MIKVLFAAATLLLCFGPAAAQAPRLDRKAHIGQHQRGCPVRRLPSGELVDCRGWRFGHGIGWDNSCFNLDYLPSSYACSAWGRR